MSWKTGLLGALTITLLGCPSAQVKPTGDSEVVVKLRRVEVKSASYDQMELAVVVSVENNTATEYAIEGASAELEIMGKGRDRQGDGEMVTSRDQAKAAALKSGAGTAEAAEEGDALVDGEGTEEEPVVEEEPVEEPAADDPSGMIDDEADASGIAGLKTSGRGPSSGKIPAFARTDVAIPMTLKLPSDNQDAFGRLVTWRRLVVKASGELRYGGKTVPLEALRELVAPNLPIVVLKSAQTASEDDGLVGAAFFDIGLENPNPFVIRVDDFSYAVEVAGKTLREMEGDKETVPPSSLQGFEENFQMTEEVYGKELRKIMRQNTVPYRLWGKTTVRGIVSEFEFTGEMQFPR